ncbi:septum formation initiator family protein [Brumimicrobium oceani]|uniref:Septum formation initiator n=1 Tax=Brumimicrobium oceani TaxID=2100725 RepID=A0A2U2XC61_9FLAO|nr:septum formation initiator family protein [Brumimicrobium oceani]PWH85385.1 septum formation initiator [Brumimicrobium oceani]
MKRLKHFKNKYIITALVFVVYMLFLDDVDVFNIIRQELKLNKLENEREILLEKFTETKLTLDQLDHTDALERFAREEKLFKRDNEDIFVIVKE